MKRAREVRKKRRREWRNPEKKIKKRRREREKKRQREVWGCPVGFPWGGQLRRTPRASAPRPSLAEKQGTSQTQGHCARLVSEKSKALWRYSCQGFENAFGSLFAPQANMSLGMGTLHPCTCTATQPSQIKHWQRAVNWGGRMDTEQGQWGEVLRAAGHGQDPPSHPVRKAQAY